MRIGKGFLLYTFPTEILLSFSNSNHWSLVRLRRSFDKILETSPLSAAAVWLPAKSSRPGARHRFSQNQGSMAAMVRYFPSLVWYTP